MVLNDKNKFLAIKASYKDKKWDLLGGAVDLPELHEDALQRECKEEAGIEITDIKPIDVQTTISDEDGSYYLFIGYICRTGNENVKLSSEHEEYRWVTKDEFINLDATEYLKDFVRGAL